MKQLSEGATKDACDACNEEELEISAIVKRHKSEFAK